MNHTYVHTRGNEQSRWFGLRIPSSGKSTPDIEKKNDFLQLVVVVVVVVVVMVMVMVVVVVVAIALYY